MRRNPTARELFKALFSEARRAFKPGDSHAAYMATDTAEGVLIHDRDFPIRETVSMGRAVTLALHWTRCPAFADVPKYRSEVHRCFSMGPNHSAVWFTAPGERLAELESAA